MEHKWRQLENQTASCVLAMTVLLQRRMTDVDRVEDKDCLTDYGVDDTLTEDGGVTGRVTDGLVEDAEVAVK